MCVAVKLKLLCFLFFLQAAAEYWLNLGVDGIKVSDVSTASSSVDWFNLVAALQANRTEDTKKR